jgi:hypothetical protein
MLYESNVFSQTEVDELRNFTATYIENISSPQQEQSRCFHVLPNMGCVKLASEKVLSLLKKKTNNRNMKIEDKEGSLYLIVAQPFSSENQAWHKDSNFKLFSAFIPLVDITGENGCLEVLMDTLKISLRNYDKQMDKKVQVTCTAGSVYAIDGRLIHRGLANQTSTTRPVIHVIISTGSSCINFAKDLKQ